MKTLLSLFEILKENEGAAVGAPSAPASVSSDCIARNPLSGSSMVRRKVKKVKLKKMLESVDFDSSHVTSVLSKLAAAGSKSEHEEVKDFGFEDSEGNIIKVSVEASQADDFKATLSKLLADYTENEHDIEVAEVLFNLRNKYNIVDVVWPKMVEDEEPVQTADGESQSNANNPEVDDVGVADDTQAPQANSGAGNVPGAMDAMLSALIADAEARRQEAVARAAEARAKEADAAARMSAQKMDAEEEVADMEAFYNSQNEEQKEAKKLAKLAKYRHQMRKSQQQLRSTAYDTALDDQDEDNFMGIDTGEDDSSGIDGGDPTNPKPRMVDRQSNVNNDPTSNLDNELKPSENEERNIPQHGNLLKALLAMSKSGARR